MNRQLGGHLPFEVVWLYVQSFAVVVTVVDVLQFGDNHLKRIGEEERELKLVAFTCPSCGAHLDVDVDNKTATCQFCGAKFPIEDETQRFKMEGAAQAGYEFEKGRQQAIAEASAQRQVPTPVQQPEPPKKRQTWLWVLGWILIFPVPLTLIMLKKKEINPKLRYGVIAAGWLIYLAIGLSGGGKKSENKVKNTGSESIATQEVTTAAENESSSVAAIEVKDSKPGEAATSDAIILEASVPGEYGREFTVYGGGSEDDTGTRLGWFVPAGTYTVKYIGKLSWEQVNYGSPEPTVNSDGFKESSQFKNVLVKPDETADINVPEGGCIYITSNTGKLELTKK